MKNRLLLLNIVLIAACGLIGAQLYQSWKSARERERQTLNRKLPPAPAPSIPVAPTPTPLAAAGYLDIAQQYILAPDRNPNVVVEVKPTPTPTPIPPFPKFYGVMNLGDGPMAILAEGQSRQKPFMQGDKVGQFKLVAIGTEDLTFEFQDKILKKRFAELQDKNEGAPADSGARTTGPAAVAPAPTPTPMPRSSGPGTDTGGGIKACVPGDSDAPGTVRDGYRKVVSDTPFGKVCRWEQVAK